MPSPRHIHDPIWVYLGKKLLENGMDEARVAHRLEYIYIQKGRARQESYGDLQPEWIEAAAAWYEGMMEIFRLASVEALLKLSRRNLKATRIEVSPFWSPSYIELLKDSGDNEPKRLYGMFITFCRPTWDEILVFTGPELKQWDVYNFDPGILEIKEIADG